MARKDPVSPILAAVRDASKSEADAVVLLEMNRWRGNTTCPRCGSNDVYVMLDRDGKRNKDYRWKCRARPCSKMFTVRTGTIFEETRLPLRVWLHAIWRACASKNGLSGLQISRECEVSYKSALFLMHRIRHAMAYMGDGPKLMGDIECDETFVGGKPRHRRVGSQNRGPKAGAPKQPVAAIVERGGDVRVWAIANVTAKNIRQAIRENVNLKYSRLQTDESPAYTSIGREFGYGHGVVTHSEHEYANGDDYSNTAESFFALVKRGLYGTFHNVSRKHLHRYLDEFAFRWNHRKVDDDMRVLAALKATEGKRLRLRS